MEDSVDSVIKKLEDLYLEIFDFENINKRQKARIFRCVSKKHCMVDHKKEPIYSLYVGDEGSDILIIGEAPSAVEGEIGGMVGGSFSNIPINNRSPIYKLRNFVKDNFGGKTPFFTDLIKCGAEKQIDKNKDNKLILREKPCFEHLLRREIEIIKPRYIFCVGDTSYNMLYKVAEIIKFDRKNIKRLTHYAHNAGKIKEFNTGINIEDKINFVWPLQTGLISYMEALKIERHKIKMSVQKVDLPP